MTKIIKIQLYCILSLLFLLFSKSSVGMVIDTPSIKAGIAKLTGTITVLNSVRSDSISINITVPHPISGEFVKYKAFTDEYGRFSIDVDVETIVSLIRFNTSLNTEKALLVKLKSEDVTHIDIAYNSDNDIESINVTPDMSKMICSDASVSYVKC